MNGSDGVKRLGWKLIKYKILKNNSPKEKGAPGKIGGGDQGPKE